MKFKKGYNNIAYLSDNFQKWFGDMEFPEIVQMEPLESKKISRYMTSEEIMREMKPEPVGLNEMYATLESLNHAVWALFYIKDVSGVLRTVCVYWWGGGWDVYAYSVSYPHERDVGYRVFSRNWNSESVRNDTLTLESFVTELERIISKYKQP